MINDFKTNKWFFFEPYVYVNVVNNKALLYNTLDGNYLVYDDKNVVGLIQDTLDERNHGVVLLNNHVMEMPAVRVFLNEIRNFFMADIIDVSLSDKKPFQMLPYSDIASSSSKFRERLLATSDNLVKYLYEIDLYLDYSSDLEAIKSFLSSCFYLKKCNIIVDGSLLDNIKDFFEFRCQLNVNSFIRIDLNDFQLISKVNNTSLHYVVNVVFPVDYSSLGYVFDALSGLSAPYEFVFRVKSFDDYEEAKQIINSCSIDKFRILPQYTGNNISFFKKGVFMDKEDILSVHTTMSDIVLRKSVNPLNFGKISIDPKGHVFTDSIHSPLGSIFADSPSEIVRLEVLKGSYWFNIRSKEPCNKCLLQWICPPPSVYESLLHRDNLCNIIL